MTIAKRLLILLAVPLLVLAGLGVLVRQEIANVEERTRFVTDSQVPSLAALGGISRSYTELRVNVRSYLFSDDQAERDRARKLFDDDKAELTRLLGIGAERARTVASATLQRAYDAIGLVPAP